MDRYRFDDAYEKVFEYDAGAKGYVFIGSYIAFDINTKMSEAEQTQIVEDELDNNNNI